MSRQRLTPHALVLAAYSAITALFTYPAVLRLTTHVPGGGDAPWFLWQLWWFKHAIVDLRQSPLITDLIYFPLRDVPVTWQSPVNELAAIPLVSAFGPVLAYNLLMLSTFVLAGYGMYLLGWQTLRRRDLAFVAGLIYSFSAYHGMRGLHHLSLATIQWLPLALVTGISFWRKPSLRRGAAAGVTSALVALSSPYYVAYFLLPAALAGGLVILIWRRPALRQPRLWLGGVAALLTALALTLPFYASLVAAEPDVQEAARQAAASVNVYTADVLSWLLPSRDNPLWQALLAPVYDKFTAGYLVETALFFGFLPLALSLIALVFPLRPKRGQCGLPLAGRAFWRLLFAMALTLSFGPVLRVWGETVIEWMPYRLFMALPGSYAFRAPARTGLTAILAGTLLALALVSYVMTRRPAWPWRPLLVAWSTLLLVNMSVAFPYPVASTDMPAAYDAIAEEDGRGAVLDLPAGDAFQDRMAWAMAYQTRHHKPLVSGYLGRRPARLQVPEQTMPFVSRFFTRSQNWDAYFAGRWQELVDWPPPQEVLAGAWPDDIRHARSLLAGQGISHVVVHSDAGNPSYFESAGLLLAQGLGPPVYSDPNTLRFDVSAPTWAARGDTAAIDSASLRFGPAFSSPFLHRQSQARAVTPTATGIATATLDLPVAGQWRIQGQWEGQGPAPAALAVDGETVDLQSAPLFDSITAFNATLDLAAGPHELAIRAPSALRTPTASDPCAGLCLLNPLVTLENPRMAALSAPLATFVDADGHRAELLSAQATQLTAPGRAETIALLTWWQLPAGADAAALPTMYVHLTDAAGNIVAQADHSLAAHSLWQSDAGAPVNLLDIVDLPAGVVEQPDLQVRVGLWAPAEQRYYWVVESARTDSASRLPLGAIADLLGN